MKIAMDLAQAVTAVLDLPPPFKQAILPAQQVLVNELVSVGVVIDQSHDALAMPQKVPDAPRIQRGDVVLSGMDLHQVIGKGHGTLEVTVGGDAAFAGSGQGP